MRKLQDNQKLMPFMTMMTKDFIKTLAHRENERVSQTWQYIQMQCQGKIDNVYGYRSPICL